MILDPKLANILSNFCLDVAKAYFVATFITPSLSGPPSLPEILVVLTKGLLNVIVFLGLSWQFSKLGDEKNHE